MIHRLRITDPANCVCPWWKTIPGFKRKKTIEFAPDLNVLAGANGSGKSTILSVIAKLLCCEAGDVQLIGQSTSQDLYEERNRNKKLLLGVHPEHDGSPIMHYAAGKAVGLMGGSFDYDFMVEGVRNAMAHVSSGQLDLSRMGTVIKAARSGQWPEIQWKIQKDFAKDLEVFLQGDGTRIRPTLLLDEPSRSLDLRMEIRLFEVIQEIARSGVQVIVATHSLLAFRLDGVHCIDTTKDYSEAVRQDLAGIGLGKPPAG